jgi:hypothetical protein
MKKSFIIHRDSLSVLAKLTNEEKGLLFQAIADYNDGIEPKLDRFMEIVFEPFRNQFIRDNDGYANRCERNANNGKRGGRPPKPTETEKTQSVILKPKKADSDSDSDSKNDNESDSDRKTQKRFTPPSVLEVKEYCTERANTIDAEKFVDHYTSNGWMVGKNHMKDWKAAVRTWEKSSIDKPVEPVVRRNAQGQRISEVAI